VFLIGFGHFEELVEQIFGGTMSIVTIAQIALGLVLVVTAAWQWPKQRVNFVSERHYVSWTTGICLGLVAAALAEADIPFGHSRQFAYGAGAVAFIAMWPLVWGWRGYKRKSNYDTPENQ
jgi:hypothetical protein